MKKRITKKGKTKGIILLFQIYPENGVKLEDWFFKRKKAVKRLNKIKGSEKEELKKDLKDQLNLKEELKRDLRDQLNFIEILEKVVIKKLELIEGEELKFYQKLKEGIKEGLKSGQRLKEKLRKIADELSDYLNQNHEVAQIKGDGVKYTLKSDLSKLTKAEIIAIKEYKPSKWEEQIFKENGKQI